MARYLHYSWLSGRCMTGNGDRLKMHRHIASRLLKALYFFLIVGLALALAAPMVAQRVTGAEQQSGIIAATVVDPNDGDGCGRDRGFARACIWRPIYHPSNDAGFFAFHDVKPGTPYRVTVRASGFAAWTSPSVEIGPSEYKLITGCKLRLADVETSVNVGYSSVEVATEQVAMQEKQRVLGVVPNFYVNYDPNPEPLTPGLKFQSCHESGQRSRHRARRRPDCRHTPGGKQPRFPTGGARGVWSAIRRHRRERIKLGL